jgi:3-hydroxy acid dehydrogenase / malonic semialdehyde reductase
MENMGNCAIFETMKNEKKVLILGASSGIGKELAKQLVRLGFFVWGTGRNETALKNLKEEVGISSKINTSILDVTKPEDLASLKETLKREGFIPDVVVISAGIVENDLLDKINTNTTRKIMETNYFGALNCVNEFLHFVNPTSQFIYISSSSAIKGTAYQGIGYGSSKSAMSLAFESFWMKWSRKEGPLFTTIYFGPVETPLHKPKGTRIFLISPTQASSHIISAIKGRKALYYRPRLLFWFLRFSKLLPSSIYLWMMTYLEDKIQ